MSAIKHLGYDKGDQAGRNKANSRNGRRTKTVITDNAGPVEIVVPRDREGTFEPVIVPKRARRLFDLDAVVLSLSAKGLTHAEISAHFADVYGASVSEDVVGRITDRVVAEMQAWWARPLEKGRFLANDANPDPKGSACPGTRGTRRRSRSSGLLRVDQAGLVGAAASSAVGGSLSCGSLWFIDAGSVSFVKTPISSRYLSQNDRIEIADGLGRKEPVKAIAARIGKSYQSVYKEVARNRKADGRFQPWHAHNAPTNAGDARRRMPWLGTVCCASWSRASWARSGPRLRSAAGCGDATPAGRRGTCVSRRSMRRCTAAWSRPPPAGPYAPVGPIGDAEAADGPGTVR